MMTALLYLEIKNRESVHRPWEWFLMYELTRIRVQKSLFAE